MDLVAQISGLMHHRDSGQTANTSATLSISLPTITGIGSTFRQQFSVAQTPGLTRQLPAQQLWDVGFDASWEMDFFGRVGRTVRAQGALAESSQYGLEDVQVSVAAEVARTYFDLRGAQRQLAVSERNATNQRKIVKLTEDRLAAGQGTAFDTERAKSVLYLTLATTPGLESQIALDRNRLAVLLGRVPDALSLLLLDSGALLRLPDTLYVGSPDQLVHRRPDVLRAERHLRPNRCSSVRRGLNICLASRFLPAPVTPRTPSIHSSSAAIPDYCSVRC